MIKKLLLVALFFLGACSLEAKELELRSYTYKSTDGFDSTIVLEEENQFSLSLNPLSSYMPVGKYTIKDNNLILETDDGLYTFVFEIKNNCLVFNKEKSSELPPFTDFPDEAIFK